MVWMYSETSCHGWQLNDGWKHAVLGNWDALKLKWLCLNSIAEDCRLALHWQLIALFIAVFSSLKLSSVSLLELLLMELGPHHQFFDTSFGCPNIHLVRIRFSLDPKIWELTPLGASAIHGWAGVAGHLAVSLSRLSVLRLSLLSIHSSFDKARTCRSYFRIWK
jgi:hypothetical protein